MAARRRKKQVSPETRRQIQRLTLMDNDFMTIALDKNNPCLEEMLRVILNKDDLVVKKVLTQRYLKGFARSVCLDIYAVDSHGVRYNIEIQQANEGADPRRARFHGGMIDTHVLKAGQDFKKLPECYVIFITRDDVLKQGKTIYTIHRYIDSDSGTKMQPFEDGSHIIYINGAAEDDGTELWKLIHDLQCANPDEMFFPRLAARAKYLKEDEEGVTVMSSYFEEQREKEKEGIAFKLIQLGEITLEKIAMCTGLTLRRVRQLAKTAPV